MTNFSTHDFCGVTIHECPSCGFDDENLAVVKHHYQHRHEIPQQQAEVMARRPQALLYDAAGAEVTEIDRGTSEPPPEISEDTAADPPEESND